MITNDTHARCMQIVHLQQVCNLRTTSSLLNCHLSTVCDLHVTRPTLQTTFYFLSQITKYQSLFCILSFLVSFSEVVFALWWPLCFKPSHLEALDAQDLQLVTR